MRGPDGNSRGFGFVEMETPEDAKEVIRHLDRAEWNGRKLLCEVAKNPRYVPGGVRELKVCNNSPCVLPVRLNEVPVEMTLYEQWHVLLMTHFTDGAFYSSLCR